MRVRFAVAASKQTDIMVALKNESLTYTDMLLLDDFIDDYHNLSLKTQSIFKEHTIETARHPHIPAMMVWTNMDGYVFPHGLANMIERDNLFTLTNCVIGDCTCAGPCAHVAGVMVYRDPKLARALLRTLMNGQKPMVHSGRSVATQAPSSLLLRVYGDVRTAHR
jgi:hypothetical protein